MKENKSPLVSVTMPVYNGMPMIKASLESLRRQTYENWECIIVDDGSTDGTSDYLDSLDDNRFVVIHLKQNCGRPVARQRALEASRGKYIGMLDADDIYHPDKLKRQVEILEKNDNVDLVSSVMCSFGTSTDLLLLRGGGNNEFKVYNGKNLPNHAPSLLRADIAKKCYYEPNVKLGEDLLFLEKYLSIGGNMYGMKDVLYYYSELDSVNKDKIRKSYWYYIWKNLSQHRYGDSLCFTAKYIYALFVFPFISINSILEKRGRPASKEERDDFNKYCKPILIQLKNHTDNE